VGDGLVVGAGCEDPAVDGGADAGGLDGATEEPTAPSVGAGFDAAATSDGDEGESARSNPPRTARNPKDAAIAATKTRAAMITAGEMGWRTGTTGTASSSWRPRRNRGQLAWAAVRQTSSCWRADWGTASARAVQRWAESTVGMAGPRVPSGPSRARYGQIAMPSAGVGVGAAPNGLGCRVRMGPAGGPAVRPSSTRPPRARPP